MVLRKEYGRVLITFTVAVETVQADVWQSVARIIIRLICDFSLYCMFKYILIF